MADKPIRAFGSNIVQLIGLLVAGAGVASLPGAGAWTAIVLGGIVLVAATARYSHYSRDA